MNRRQFRAASRRIYYVRGVSTLSSIRHARHPIARTVTVVGPKRGGTTWLQELLSSARETCPIFEPTSNDRVVRAMGRGFEPAIPVGGSAPDLEEHLRAVMSGQRVTAWSMQLASVPQLLRARHLVVKHVTLCLSAGWLGERFPESPMVVVVRHPCAVVQSLMAVPWSEDTFETILDKRSPDEARQVRELLDGQRSVPATYAAMWAIEVGALLHDTDAARSHLIAYEAAVADPAGVVGPIVEAAGLPGATDLIRRARQPSQMASAHSVTRRAGDPVTAWVDRLAAADRAEVLDIVRRAGLVGYGEDPYPDLEALAEEHRRTSAP